MVSVRVKIETEGTGPDVRLVDAELERGKALMKGDTLVIRFCLYGFLKSEPPRSIMVAVDRWPKQRVSVATPY